MFYIKLKKDALSIHEEVANEYNAAYEKMMKASEELYDARIEAVKLIERVELFINSIANTPKEFDKKLGEIMHEVQKFKETEEYVKEAINNTVTSGINVAASVVAGQIFREMGPKTLMQIATTFGKTSTGQAIKTLSRREAKKAALKWLGGKAGIKGGKALLGMAGPVGTSITVVSTGISLISWAGKNKEIANDAINEAEEMVVAKAELKECTESICDLYKRTNDLYAGLQDQFRRVEFLRGANYLYIKEEEAILLGTIVNNTLALASLVNEIIE